MASRSPPDGARGIGVDDLGDLVAGAATLGVPLDAGQVAQLMHYAELLQRWNAVHNLTAIDEPAQIVSHHLLDSLSVVPTLGRLAASRPLRLLDVGSGGGLPGIPLAIVCPSLHVTLVDKVRKKLAFLTQARLELGLANLETVHARVEALRSPLFDVIVSRAYASLADFVASTRHLLAPHGWWCAMKGTLPSEEIDALTRDAPAVRVVEIVKLAVPRVDAARHLVVLQPA